jgi:gamma-glutamyltranspeptidase/glutathione hydrolase
MNFHHRCTITSLQRHLLLALLLWSGLQAVVLSQEKPQEKLQEKPQGKQEREKENAVSQNAATQPVRKEPVFGTKAMVVSAHPEASRVGAEVLRRGGNAIDAAIAVELALAVCYPVAGNIGGGGFMVIRLNNGTTAALDFREAASELASKDMFLDSAGKVIPKLSTYGHKASGVPATVDGMVQAHKKYGKLAWKFLVQPAIELARKGVIVTEREARGLNNVANTLKEYNPDKTYFLTTGTTWKAGDTLVQEDLAKTLERIRDKGRDGFYKGTTAALLLAEMKRGGGLLTQADLDKYRAKWRTPLVSEYKRYRVIGMPPPSSGGIGVAQMLPMVQPYPLKEWGHNTEKTAHLMIEAERRYYAERAEYLGDPDFYNVPVKGLLHPAYITERMKSFNPDRATPSSELTHGDRAQVQHYESMETTHFSIVDPSGNAVSVTTTLNGGYGSKVVVGGAGFFMNNEMDDFSVKPGVPNMFGAVGGEANAIQPHKRMLSSMTPTIVEAIPESRTEAPTEAAKPKRKKNAREKKPHGELLMVVGSPGGTTIITSVFQTILNVVEHGMTMQEAVNARRFHHQHVPDVVMMETGAFSEAVQQALKAKGHTINEIPAIGKVDAVLVRKQGKMRTLEGGADPRGDDTAVGY